MDQNVGAQPADGRGYGGGGSVKRARERMNARFEFGIPNSPPKPVRQQAPDGEVPKYPGRRQGPIPAALKSRTPNIPTISRPTPAQDYQWPFLDNSNASGSEPSRIPRGPTPQRPPRPSYVPLILDPNVQAFSPSSPDRSSPRQLQPPQRQDVPVASPSQRIEAYYDEDSSFQSPISYERDSQYSSDRPSTVSSTGSIPDFPIPAMPIAQAGPPRRIPNTGPPPASRRGPSSYYSQASFVSPIPEEMPDAMRASGSYASSKPIASSWGSRPEDIDIDEFIDDIEEEDDEGRADSAASQHSESANLVRQASLGKKARPRLTTVGSQDDSERLRRQDSSTLGKGAGIVGSNKNTPQDRPLMPQFPSLSDDDDLSSSVQSSESSVRGALSIPVSQSKTILTSSSDPHLSRVADFDRTSMGLADRIPAHIRPPKLDLSAVRDAEARGSLTSLPDLIRRATRVAHNLEKGRTASRLGLADFLNAASVEKLEKDSLSSESRNNPNRRSGSVSDILAAFPAPSMLTPTGERPISRWPSAYRITNLQQQMNYETLPEARSKEKIPSPGVDSERKQRRCCGMRLWVFLLLLLVIFLLVAAAVIIPVVLLVVVPREQNNTSTSNSTSSCASTDPCKNGGVSVFTDNACRCICVNGFTGTHCGIQSDAGCTSITEDLGSNNQDAAATVGDAIPRLFSASSTNFSIPLHDQELLGLFSSTNLSCASENALVTFDGKATKRFFILPEIEPPEFTEDVVPLNVEKRHIEDILIRRDANAATATTDGIVYQATGTTTAATHTYTASTTTQDSSATSTTSSSSTTSTSPSGLNLTQDTLDFSRIAVLFIFDVTTSLTSAMDAQTTIQDFLYTGTTTNMSMSMGTSSGSTKNFTLNFLTFTITLGNGTIFGGEGNGIGGLISSNSSSSTNVTKREEGTVFDRRRRHLLLD